MASAAKQHVEITPVEQVEAWFARHGWSPFAFQRKVWQAYLEGRSGLIHSATGTGKTYAAWMAPVIEQLSTAVPASGLQVLWITPLRALAADTAAALMLPLEELGLDWVVETRTGDTSGSVKAKQRERLPQALVTTPESLSLLLAREDASTLFAGLKCVIVDEWHELMGSKRGVQTELGLARLRRWNPALRTWGISATLGNLDEAMQTLLGETANRRDEETETQNPTHPLGDSPIHRFPDSQPPLLVEGEIPKEVIIDALLPDTIERFPWAGHLNTQMLPKVVQAIEESRSCLLFTNTRSQTEIWFQAILAARPDWKGQIEIHHGSLDREVRDAVERGIKNGQLRAVVCTSSLDLGVDFTPVDRVLQIGSPKGVARLLQRAGRSGHQPGVPSRVTCVPTFALELIDEAAVRDAALAGKIESRLPFDRPLDVLTQHLVTIALGGGFRSEELYDEVRTTHAYKDLSRDEWQWAMDFVTKGGNALKAYAEYKKVVENDGVYTVEDKHIARRHRMSIGTITSDSAMTVQYLRGHKLGTVEESFIARLQPGDKFVFSGKPLQFVRVKDMAAIVRPASSIKGAVPRWMGGRLPLSGELAHAVREKLEQAHHGELDSPEMRVLAPLLEVQARWSHIPETDELLIEKVKTRDGHHLFIFPIEGRLVHEGLGALFAYRMAQIRPITFTVACNDYGLQLLSTEEAPLEEALENGLLSRETLGEDILASLNSVEMARRQFREIARISGLIFQGFPGSHKSMRQIQASSGLFYEVFRQYDPENMLLAQANREVLERQLEHSRLGRALERLSQSRIVITNPPQPTPMAFPIIIDFNRQTVSTESFTERVQKMVVRLEKAAGEPRDKRISA